MTGITSLGTDCCGRTFPAERSLRAPLRRWTRPAGSTGIHGVVRLWATPPRQKVPGGQGCGLCIVGSAGSSVNVPSNRNSPRGTSARADSGLARCRRSPRDIIPVCR